MNSKKKENDEKFNGVEFGRRIREALKRSNTLPEKLGDACGFNMITVRQIEKGEKLPSIPMFIKICDNLQISPAYFLGNEVQVPITENGWNELAEQMKNMPEKSRSVVKSVLESLMKNLAEKGVKEQDGDDIFDRKEFGRRLRKVRQEMQMTSQNVADKCGVSSVFIRQIEIGKKLPSLAGLVKICQTLQISPAYLFGNELKLEITEFGSDEIMRIQCDMTAKAQMIAKNVLTILLRNLESKTD